MTTFSTTREIPSTVEQVFAAISDPVRLSRWWGPAGFTNSFHICDFRTGGRWSFIMHGPNGADYPNESTFVDIGPPKRVVIRHESEPRFHLTIQLEAFSAGTMVTWTQVFGNPEVGRRLESVVVPANEQNLDRLTAEVLRNPTD